MSIRVIKSATPRPLAHYSGAVVSGDLVFAAGQLASDFKTGVPAEARRHPSFPYYGSDIELQTEYVLGNLAKMFRAAGSSLDHVVKAQVFLYPGEPGGVGTAEKGLYVVYALRSMEGYAVGAIRL